MHTEIYKGLEIGVFTSKIKEGWSIKWEIMKPVFNGKNPLKAELLTLMKEIDEEEALSIGIREAIRYIDKNF